MPDEESVGERWAKKLAGTHVDKLIRTGVATLINMAVEEEVALERARCAACAEYELQASAARANDPDRASYRESHAQGAAVANWIKKAILRGDKGKIYK